jgi:hypothetical protein
MLLYVYIYRETHWSQTLFYIDDPCAVIQDTVIKGSISIKPHADAHRYVIGGILCFAFVSDKLK